MVIYHKPFSYCNVGIQECFVINCDGCFLIGQSLKFMTNHKNFKVNHNSVSITFAAHHSVINCGKISTF